MGVVDAPHLPEPQRVQRRWREVNRTLDSVQAGQDVDVLVLLDGHLGGDVPRPVDNIRVANGHLDAPQLLGRDLVVSEAARPRNVHHERLRDWTGSRVPHVGRRDGGVLPTIREWCPVGDGLAVVGDDPRQELSPVGRDRLVLAVAEPQLDDLVVRASLTVRLQTNASPDSASALSTSHGSSILEMGKKRNAVALLLIFIIPQN